MMAGHTGIERIRSSVFGNANEKAKKSKPSFRGHETYDKPCPAATLRHVRGLVRISLASRFWGTAGRNLPLDSFGRR